MTKTLLIAVVDDDESVRESLYGFLESLGFAVATFSSAEAFLSSGSLRETDCLLLDVKLSELAASLFLIVVIVSASRYETLLIIANFPLCRGHHSLPRKQINSHSI
jgi:FixJ family two-component response regulator